MLNLLLSVAPARILIHNPFYILSHGPTPGNMLGLIVCFLVSHGLSPGTSRFDPDPSCAQKWNTPASERLSVRSREEEHMWFLAIRA